MDKNTKNNSINLDNLSLEVYNNRQFAESYANKIEYNSHNALYERPAMFSLIGDVRNKKVLDAGCGPGVYADRLLNAGAEVTAVEYSDEMIALTKDKVGDKAKIYKANLNHPMDFLADESFDIIVCSMVVHYVRDWQTMFSEFNRVLRSGGELIFSSHHPFMDFENSITGNYFECELLKDEWPSYNVKVSFYRRSLSEMFAILRETGFKIDEVIEPLPVDECRTKFPDAYEVLSTKPWFICFKVIKES
ncbi:MAG: class I SAM-dependent methyltransferase [bacterium]|nr:class I SAM-dependent methyltransferase [bacterium]